MAKKKKKKESKNHFETWFLMLNEGHLDIDHDDEDMTLEEFLEALREYLS